MIKQVIDIKEYNWKVYVYYNVSKEDDLELENCITKLKLPTRYITEAYTMLYNNIPNCGFTYSNIATNKSIIAITKTTNATQFVNSFVHEVFHLVNHIASKYDISFDSEEVCYIAGNLSQQMFERCHTLMCDCCRND